MHNYSFKKVNHSSFNMLNKTHLITPLLFSLNVHQRRARTRRGRAASQLEARPAPQRESAINEQSPAPEINSL
ncbi:hypothetical protein EUGRSUZ_B03505 [Eucalyptus grandis]|uniref:Uncharacterized protein n=2 Tax=Eucalyptus grandis TaxID=71139 RepID=A0ACC3LXB2_EUCGR|nr:hypothetical protein EUGRSUZ_B03505 [Eucalyptus grandis]